MHFGNEQYNQDQLLQDEEEESTNYNSQFEFQRKQVNIFGAKSQETKNESYGEEKRNRGFNLSLYANFYLPYISRVPQPNVNHTLLNTRYLSI